MIILGVCLVIRTGAVVQDEVGLCNLVAHTTVEEVVGTEVSWQCLER